MVIINEISKQCLDCLTDISNRGHRSLRCVFCANIQNYQKKLEATERYRKTEKSKKWGEQYRQKPERKEYQKTYMSQWKKDNKERHSELNILSEKRNPKSKAKRNKKYRESENGKEKARLRSQTPEFKIKRRAYQITRRALGYISKQTILDILEKQDYRCNNPHCSIDIRPKYDVDHVIPIVAGGTNEDNLQILCIHCNRSKSDRDWNMFLELYLELE